MEDKILELTDSQIMKDNFAKVLLGATAGFIAGQGVQKIYDKAMTVYRLKKAATGES